MFFRKAVTTTYIKAGREIINIHGEVNDQGAEEVAQALREVRENNPQPNLKALRFFKSKISDHGIRLIANELQYFTNLRKIEFDFCFIQREGAKGIADLVASNEGIEEFIFWRNCPNEETWQELCSCGGIRENECNSWIDVFAQVLKSHPSITIVDLSAGTIDDAAAESLGTIIRTNPTIQRLDLSYSKISSRNMRLICEAIAANNTLEFVRAQFCGDPPPDAMESGIEVYQFLQIAKEILSVERCKIFDKFDVLQHLDTVKEPRMAYGMF